MEYTLQAKRPSVTKKQLHSKRVEKMWCSLKTSTNLENIHFVLYREIDKVCVQYNLVRGPKVLIRSEEQSWTDPLVLTKSARSKYQNVKNKFFVPEEKNVKSFSDRSARTNV